MIGTGRNDNDASICLQRPASNGSPGITAPTLRDPTEEELLTDWRVNTIRELAVTLLVVTVAQPPDGVATPIVALLPSMISIPAPTPTSFRFPIVATDVLAATDNTNYSLRTKISNF